MTVDFTPLYRNSVGFDRMLSLLDNSLRSEPSPGGYPPYNIEAVDENRYAITLAVAILISLVVSLTLTPMMCAKLLKPAREENGKPDWVERLIGP